MKNIFVLCCLFISSIGSTSAITVQDDGGKNLTFVHSPRRIITVAPHLTELVFAAGGGDRIVGTVDYSDFPPAAKNIPRIGGDSQIDIERVITLKPDLIIAWQSGNTQSQHSQLRGLGIPVFASEPRKLRDIPLAIEKLGLLMGTEAVAKTSASNFRGQLAALESQYGGRRKLRVFYQVWDKPLYTLSGAHIVTDAMRVCGAENVFSSLKIIAPNVTTEAVLKENPDVILSDSRAGPAGTGFWKKFSAMKAVRQGNLFSIESDLLSRSGPRMIAGTATLCQLLDQARIQGKE